MRIAQIVTIGLLLFANSAIGANKPPPDISGVWAVFQTTRASGQRALGDPPLSKQGQTIVDQFRNGYDLKDMAPNEHCIEPGLPTDMFGIGNQLIEIVQQPERITMLVEMGPQWRRIFLDGRQAPTGYPATRNGFSVGRWENDTLTIETTLLKEWFMPRWAHTENARLVERFSLKKTADIKQGPRGNYNPGILGDHVLVDELTLIDPALYDAPATITIYYRRLADHEFLENNCTEGLWWQQMDKRRK